MKILRGRGLRKILDTQKGGSEKIRRGSDFFFTLNPKGGKWRGVGGVLKN